MESGPGTKARLGVLLAFIVVLGVPLAFRPRHIEGVEAADHVIILTPHNEQIRFEFGRAFEEWHRKHYGRSVAIDWRYIGGTAEIRRLLIAQYTAALSNGRLTPAGEAAPGAGPLPFDLLFGGGSFEHEQLKRGVSVRPSGSDKDSTVSISVPMGFGQDWLDRVYSENRIGSTRLFDPGDSSKGDPGQYWLGNALSGFGIVFNRDILARIGVEEPRSWSDMTDPGFAGWISLADPRQSGSVATAYESVLNCYGWDKGWRTLRAIAANARSFANSAPKVSIDVSQGEAAAGVTIDFYGRYQSQAVMRAGETPETSRVGYIDPPGEAYIDVDPISVLRAGPHPEVARRFVEFLLSDEGQALWQFKARKNLKIPPGDHLGPERFELRRMPVRRDFYQRWMVRMVDRVDPFETVANTASRGWRPAVAPMMAVCSIDIHDELKSAWAAMNSARRRGAGPSVLEEMDRLMFAMPDHRMLDGTVLPFTEANFPAILRDWREAEKDGRINQIRIAYSTACRANYRGIVELSAGVR